MRLWQRALPNSRCHMQHVLFQRATFNLEPEIDDKRSPTSRKARDSPPTFRGRIAGLLSHLTPPGKGAQHTPWAGMDVRPGRWCLSIGLKGALGPGRAWVLITASFLSAQPRCDRQEDNGFLRFCCGALAHCSLTTGSFADKICRL